MLCPRCSTERVGAFRFCLTCGLDYDLQHASVRQDWKQPSQSATAPEETSQPQRPSYLERAGLAPPRAAASPSPTHVEIPEPTSATAYESAVATVPVASEPRPLPGLSIDANAPPRIEALEPRRERAVEAASSAVIEPDRAAAPTVDAPRLPTAAITVAPRAALPARPSIPEPITIPSSEFPVVAAPPPVTGIGRTVRRALAVAGALGVVAGVVAAVLVLNRPPTSPPVHGVGAPPAVAQTAGPAGGEPAGVIVFGPGLVDGTIVSPVDRIAVGKSLAWIAKFTRPTVNREVTMSVVRIDGGEEKTVLSTRLAIGPNQAQTSLSGMNSDMIGAGTFAMRILDGDTPIAEGTIIVEAAAPS
jgi:hypothetical protein